jgi:prepilin-type N-terminal cleavage/methylation domain-containing protein
MKQQTGFSLIELLVVIAIILIIVAIAVPNLMRSQMAANEASAIESIRSITTAQATYAATYPDLGFAPTLASLGFGALPGTSAQHHRAKGRLYIQSCCACSFASHNLHSWHCAAEPWQNRTTGILLGSEPISEA